MGKYEDWKRRNGVKGEGHVNNRWLRERRAVAALRVGILAVFIATFALLAQCGRLVDADAPRRTAETMGFMRVHVTERHIFMPSLHGCAREDALAADIEAVNATGASVRAVVCCGWPWKGCTLRVR